MPSACLCVRFLLYLTLCNYLLSGKFYHYFHEKVFRVTEYRFWYSIIGCASEYPVNRVLVAIPISNWRLCVNYISYEWTCCMTSPHLDLIFTVRVFFSVNNILFTHIFFALQSSAKTLVFWPWTYVLRSDNGRWSFFLFNKKHVQKLFNSYMQKCVTMF
jgi:hypothetical protein